MNPNTSRLFRAARTAAPAVAALALTMAFAGTAQAAPSYVTRSNNTVQFAAMSGEQNNVTFTRNTLGQLVVTDTGSALFAGPGCVQVSPTTVRCGTGVTRIQASMGDRNDVVTNDTMIPSDIDGGSGQDRIIGGRGNDRLTDPDGWNTPTMATTFEGREGNDSIISRNGGFDRIDCGENSFDFDVLIADPANLDAVVLNTCEYVDR
ncbi:hypothetical protein ACWDYJ_19230 [Streptomyces sp. NPDC003042]